MEAGFSVKCQPARQELIHTHSHTKCNLELGILPKDTDKQTGGVMDQTNTTTNTTTTHY